MSSNTQQRVTLFLGPFIIKHAKAHAVIEGLSLARLVEKALVAYLPKVTILKKPVIHYER
ncbi:MAG: hypothetical protein WC901_05680 [Candidatus Margulisiibacteriota bacterium]